MEISATPKKNVNAGFVNHVPFTAIIRSYNF